MFVIIELYTSIHLVVYIFRYLPATLEFKIDILQHRWIFGGVAHEHVLEYDFTI